MTDQTFLDSFQSLAKQNPDGVYLTQPLAGGAVTHYTFAAALDQALRMAAHLRQRGFPPGSHIALASKNCAHWLIADLAIWLAGYVTIPIYPTLTGETVRQILEHSEAKLIFVGKLDDWNLMKSGIAADLPTIALPLAPDIGKERWDDLVARSTPLREPSVRKPDEIATIVYTSGTTGTAKGVMLTFKAMSVSGRGFAEMFAMGPSDRVLSYLPLAHVFERAVIEIASFYAGFHVFFAESLDTFVEDLKRARPTFFISVPRLWTKFRLGVLAKVPESKLERLLGIPIVSYFIRKKVLKGLGLDACRVAGSGSAPISADVLNWYRRLGLTLLEGYGMTENFSWSHINRPGRARVGTVGEACPGVEHRIGPDSEVLVKSAASMSGYYKEPALTKAAFTDDGFLKTGDRGTIDEHGSLLLTGRTKELFKTSKGKYVAPAPIESRLLVSPLLEQVCVAGAGKPQPHALVVLAEQTRSELAGGKIDRTTLTSHLKALRDSVNASLDPHEHLEFLAVLPEPWSIENGLLTPTMKVKRNEIEKRFEPQADRWYEARTAIVWI